MADGSGQVTLAQSYTPFGVPLWHAGSGVTGYGFTGERWEAYANLLFLRARYYKPGMGRFIGKDPWPGTFQKPGTLHGYVYVLNDVPNGIDPSGMLCIFGLGDCDKDPDLAAVACYYFLQTDSCIIIGDTYWKLLS